MRGKSAWIISTGVLVCRTGEAGSSSGGGAATDDWLDFIVQSNGGRLGRPVNGPVVGVRGGVFGITTLGPSTANTS